MKRYNFAFASILLAAALSLVSVRTSAQNLNQYKKDVKKLASTEFEGRAYYNDGMNRAADYIAKRFKSYGVKPIKESFFQEFSYDVNVFHGDAQLFVDDRPLKAGDEWVMREFSKGCKGTFPLFYIDTLNYNNEKFWKNVDDGAYDHSFIVLDWGYYRSHSDFFGDLSSSRVKGLILRWSVPLKFYKAYSDFVSNTVVVWVNESFPNDAKHITINVDSEFLKDYKVKNVIGMISGSKYPDSVMVFTAHYDHLGHLGKDLYFPGANDNASGTAMLLNLAEYYAKHQPEYTVVFMAFAGEESNIRGSKYYVENPLFPLSYIRYLINLDMIGDNGKSLFVATNEIGEHGLHLIETINKEQRYFKSLERVDLECNSDHYPFTEKNVPAILMIFEEGDAFPIYHTYHDNDKTIKYDNFEKVFRLLTGFAERY